MACEECGTEFVPKQKIQRFCSPLCQQRNASRRWRKRNPDYFKGYYSEHRERRIAEAVDWGKANPGKRQITSQRYYVNNTEIHAARVQAWKDANPNAMRLINARSSAKRRATLAGLPTEPFSLVEIFERDGWVCQLCGDLCEPPTPRGRWSASLDHIVPISHPECPGHIRSNVQTAHLSCNVRKHNRPPEGSRLL